MLKLQINVENRPLQDRITQIRRFRRQHDTFIGFITQVLASTRNKKYQGVIEVSTVKEIHEIYLRIREIDVLAGVPMQLVVM